MPWGDGSGPNGMGPMTGRGAGYCAGYNAPGYANSGSGGFFGRGFGRGLGRGFGRGFGRGLGFRRFAPAYAQPAQYVPVQSVPVQVSQVQPQSQPQVQYTKEDEIADLRAEKEIIMRDMKAIEGRLKELEKK
ncbi:MAG: DUF5320 domain-containing protein [Candidatus Aenigmarchaeota archaeon]|nr:DUF5320 domain-containing protein [Candidatus Aenigmarchaeota archaeon]